MGGRAMMFTVERWREFYPEAAPLMHRHWEEIAIDREQIKLGLNVQKYQEMDDNNILHILAARENGALAGYYMAFLLPHVHYQDAGLMAFTDIYFLAPEHRRGSNGVQLFIEAEKSLRDKGVTKAYLSTKIHHDNGPIFEALGWNASDRVYTKLLGD